MFLKQRYNIFNKLTIKQHLKWGGGGGGFQLVSKYSILYCIIVYYIVNRTQIT